MSTYLFKIKEVVCKKVKNKKENQITTSIYKVRLYYFNDLYNTNIHIHTVTHSYWFLSTFLFQNGRLTPCCWSGESQVSLVQGPVDTDAGKAGHSGLHQGELGTAPRVEALSHSKPLS